MTAARQASSVPAHCTPRFSNIWVENRGKPAATAERSMMLAATVDAALVQVEVSAEVTMKENIKGASSLTEAEKHQQDN
jgi:hypothetical protein